MMHRLQQASCQIFNLFNFNALWKPGSPLTEASVKFSDSPEQRDDQNHA